MVIRHWSFLRSFPALLLLATLCADRLAGADDFRRTYFAAEARANRGDSAGAEEFYRQALAAAGEDDSGSAGDPSPGVVRRRAQSWLAEHARRQRRHDEALEFGLRFRAELELLARAGRLPVGPYQRENELAIAADHLALGEYPPARAVLEDLLAGRFGEPGEFQRMAVLIRLALVDELTSRDESAARRYREALSLGEALQQRLATGSGVNSIRVLRQLVLCREGLNQPHVADELLSELLDMGNQSEALAAIVELTSHAAHREQYARAQAFLELGLSRAASGLGLRGRAEIATMLAWALARQGQIEEANRRWEMAAGLYETLVESPAAINDQPAHAAALRTLVRIYQQMGRLRDAMEAAERLLALYKQTAGSDHPLSVETRGSLGHLYAAAGYYSKARPLLAEAVDLWRRRADRRPLDFARALNGLGAVERAAGDFDRAAELFTESLDLRRRHLPDDAVDIAETENNLASVLVTQGRFREAIDLYGSVRSRCLRHGPAANGLRAGVLQNLATAWRTQGQFDRAEEYARLALELYQQEFGDDAPQAVSALNLLAALAREQDRASAARQLAEQALDVCRRGNRLQTALAAGVYDNLGMISIQSGDLATSATHFQSALEIHEALGRRDLEARTRNALGVLAFRRGRADDAADLLREADAIQSEIAARPFDRYNTLCNLAAVRRAQGDRAAAIEALERAIALLEQPRMGVAGAEQERAEFLGLMAPAFDQLVDLYFEKNLPADAIFAAERGRNRTFLDQLDMAGVDLRRTLPDDEAVRALLRREQELQLAINEARACARTLSIEPEPDRDQLARLARQVTQAEDELAGVWREIRSRSPVYQQRLAQSQTLITLEEFRRDVLPQGALLLFYYVGREKSWLLAAGGPSGILEHYELSIPAAQIEPLRDVVRLTTPLALPGERSLGDPVPTKLEEEAIDAAAARLASGSVDREMLNVLVGTYRLLLRSRAFGVLRGLGEPVRTRLGRPITEPVTALADILLPPPVRRLVEEQQPRVLIVVPDGALHSLPLESLLLEDGEPGTFVLDRFPPIAYAPSANILARLRQRPDAGAGSDPLGRVLSVGDPAYLQRSDAGRDAVAFVTREAILGVAGQLPRLPQTEAECRRIEHTLAGGRRDVTILLAERATERNVVEAARECRVIHLAAHGLVDERPGNLFGAIALAPPAAGESVSQDDGLLSYGEILDLPLSACELAVLSACETNVGPFRPLEAGTSLAQAFLAAGARRVVASHWKVSDASTAELMAAFFERLASRDADARLLDYAAALHEARLKVRRDENHPEWAAPYYWAPFVLLGPAGDAPASH